MTNEPPPLPTTLPNALHNLAAISQARTLLLAESRGADLPLAGIAHETDRLTTLLNLISDLPPLQTLEVAAKVHQLTQLAASHSSSMMIMAADSIGRRPRKKELGPQDGAYVHLEVVCSRLGEVRGELEGLVRGGSGLVRGGVKEGFWVSRREVVAVGERVRGVLGGGEMGVVERLWVGGRLEGEGDDVIRLDEDDAAALGLPQTTSARVEQWRAGVSE